MVKKINKTPPSEPYFIAFPKPATQVDLTYQRSSISSLKIGSIFSWVPTLMNRVWWTVKSVLFFWIRYPKDHPTTFNPEINPHSLSSRDPFYKMLFNTNQELRNKTAYQLCTEIFDFLGEGGIYYWKLHLNEINKKKEEVFKHDLHPLESLYFLFHNKEMTKLVCHFLDRAIFGIGKAFIQEFAAKFKASSKSIKPQVLGFCKLLNLDRASITRLVEQQKWQELIEFVYKTRKKHFNL